MFLTVIVIEQFHGEADIVGESTQVLHKKEKLPNQQHRCLFGVLHCDPHLYVLVPIAKEFSWDHIHCTYSKCHANFCWHDKEIKVLPILSSINSPEVSLLKWEAQQHRITFSSLHSRVKNPGQMYIVLFPMKNLNPFCAVYLLYLVIKLVRYTLCTVLTSVYPSVVLCLCIWIWTGRIRSCTAQRWENVSVMFRKRYNRDYAVSRVVSLKSSDSVFRGELTLGSPGLL